MLSCAAARRFVRRRVVVHLRMMAMANAVAGAGENGNNLLISSLPGFPRSLLGMKSRSEACLQRESHCRQFDS
jgi:hypothetical protein